METVQGVKIICRYFQLNEESLSVIISLLPFPPLLLPSSIRRFGFLFYYSCHTLYYCQICSHRFVTLSVSKTSCLVSFCINHTYVEEKVLGLLFIYAALAELIIDCTGHATQGPVSAIKFIALISSVEGLPTCNC